MMTGLRHKLWLAFGSLLLIVLAVSALSVAVLTRHTHSLERIFRENYDSAVYCDGMKACLEQLNFRAEQVLWGTADAPAPETGKWTTLFESNLRAQLGNCYLPGEAEESRHVEQLWGEYKSDYRQFETSSAEQKAGVYRDTLLPKLGELLASAQRIADMNMTNMVSVHGQARQMLVGVRRALIALVVAGSGLAALVVWTVGVKIVRPISELTGLARQVEQGNLDLTVSKASTDEIGQLAEAFNSMTSHLREFKRIDHDRLIRTQQTTQLAIDSLPDAVFVIGPEDTIEISNDFARKYFGIEPGRRLSGQGLNWLPPLVDEVKTNCRAVELQGYGSAIQIFVDGEERFLLPRVVPMLSADGRQLGIVAILVDVTQLRHVDEAKSGLLSTVSHELRTPLTSQRLLLGLLMSSAGLTAAQKRMLEVVKTDSDRLHRTIDHLLGIGRIESGRPHFQFRAMAPEEIVMSAVEPLRQLFADQKIDLNVDVAGHLPRVRADSTALHSALTNLVSNALKFTPAGGAVTVGCENGGGRVNFSVSDTGPGIPPEFRDRIFEKFFRVPVSSGPSGAGLGLSITKNIVEAHGGQISFTCPPTGGTVFRFALPAQTPAERI
jgi:signal transduction histidine kinase/HAMP domain-containing protein